LQSTHKEEQLHIKVSQNVTILTNLKGSEQLCGGVNLLMDEYDDNVQTDLSGKTACAQAQAKLYCTVFIKCTSDPYKDGYCTCQGLYRVTVTK
jgi:hypothetical protein